MNNNNVDRGATLTEYGILAGLIAAAAIAAVFSLGQRVSSGFEVSSQKLSSARVEGFLASNAGPSDYTPVNQACGQYMSFDYNLDGIQTSIESNLWNAQSNGTQDFPEEICIETNAYYPSLAEPWAWEWSIPGSGDYQIVAYPEAVIGQKPYRNLGDAPFSAPIASRDITLHVDYGISNHTGRNNVAISMWLTNAPQSTPSTISNEVMIWLDDGGIWPGGTIFAQDILVDGRLWDLYASSDWSDASGAFDGNWSYYAFVPAQEGASITSADLDISAFLDDLRSRGMVSSEEYLPSIEFGTEVLDGTGRLELYEFTVDVTQR